MAWGGWPSVKVRLLSCSLSSRLDTLHDISSAPARRGQAVQDKDASKLGRLPHARCRGGCVGCINAVSRFCDGHGLPCVCLWVDWLPRHISADLIALGTTAVAAGVGSVAADFAVPAGLACEGLSLPVSALRSRGFHCGCRIV